jgi:hypothetical protein
MIYQAENIFNSEKMSNQQNQAIVIMLFCKIYSLLRSIDLFYAAGTDYNFATLIYMFL